MASLGNGRNVEILKPFAGKLIELLGFFHKPSLHAWRCRVGDQGPQAGRFTFMMIAKHRLGHG